MLMLYHIKFTFYYYYYYIFVFISLFIIFWWLLKVLNNHYSAAVKITKPHESAKYILVHGHQIRHSGSMDSQDKLKNKLH